MHHRTQALTYAISTWHALEIASKARVTFDITTFSAFDPNCVISFFDSIINPGMTISNQFDKMKER